MQIVGETPSFIIMAECDSCGKNGFSSDVNVIKETVTVTDIHLTTKTARERHDYAVAIAHNEAIKKGWKIRPYGSNYLFECPRCQVYTYINVQDIDVVNKMLSAIPRVRRRAIYTDLGRSLRIDE